MSFVERYLSYKHLLVSLLLAGVVLGILSFKELPLNFFPDANYPQVVVVLQLPGASADDVEREVAIPVEKELSTISLVRRVRSVCRDGVAVISVEFEYKKSLAEAQLDVSNALDKIMGSLPKTLLPPRIFKISAATTPVMTVAVYPAPGTNLTLPQVRRLVTQYIKPELLKLPKIGDVEVFGGYTREVIIKIDRDKLARYHLSLLKVISAIYQQNKNLPSGVIHTKSHVYFIKIAGEREIPQKLGSIKIPIANGKSIPLKDIAEIKLGFADRYSLFHGNGIPAIGMNILRPTSGNVMDTIEVAKKALKRLEKLYPRLKFKVVDTQENLIKTSVDNLIGALRDAITLTVIVMFLFLARFRATLLAAVSIPTTYFLTFFLMSLFHMELNIVTMTAIILAVGLLVDDSIVVAENIERHIRELGIPPARAAITGTEEIMLADLAGTFTTVIVLVPILFVGGYVEKIMRPLALTLILALCASYVVSITVIPLLAPYVLKKDKPGKWESWFFKVNERVLNAFKNFYSGIFEFGSKYTILLILLAVVALVTSLKFVFPVVGRNLMPPMDTGIIKVSFEITPNTSVESAEKVIDKMEHIIKGIKGFVSMDTVLGSEPGVISFGADRTPYQGIITVHIVDRFHRKKTIWQIEDALYKKLVKVPGLKRVSVFEYGATPLSSILAPVDIMVSGKNPTLIYDIAKKIQTRLYSVPGLVSVSHTWDFDREEVILKPDPYKLAYYGLTPEVIARELTAAFSGIKASLWHIPEESPYLIKVRLPYNQRKTLENILEFAVPTKKGLVPLKELLNVKEKFVRGLIVRQDLSPVIDVLGYRRTTPISFINANVIKALQGLKLPKGVSISREGEVKQMKISFDRLKKALVISLILLYFSLVPTFRSFKHPLTIMLAIPLSLIGAMWGLLIMDKHFCMPALMGIILLSGVVVNNSILLIDFIEKARAKGATLKDAIKQSIRARTRPILMTAFSTITGMIPIAAEYAIGLERLSPLAVVAIGGLLVGTFLTLVYIPLFYYVLEKISSKLF